MQIYHETMFDGPWYECVGPSASEVRNDLIKKYKNGWYAKNDYFKHSLVYLKIKSLLPL